MRYLLDTHALVWAVSDPTKLSIKVRRILEKPTNERLVSPVSVWEMSIKHALGKWPEVASFMDEAEYHSDLEQLQAKELWIGSGHARLAGQFAQSHKDPFDRLLVAQAVLEGMPILSKDRVLDIFPVVRVW